MGGTCWCSISIDVVRTTPLARTQAPLKTVHAPGVLTRRPMQVGHGYFADGGLDPPRTGDPLVQMCLWAFDCAQSNRHEPHMPTSVVWDGGGGTAADCAGGE
mmetsp:Transcript_65329/g.108496  ORF Transcript_65329/g.108496 Transcript_65329/m.108496 type:complete len:102 (+) Transcript_65329:540-845(+)